MRNKRSDKEKREEIECFLGGCLKGSTLVGKGERFDEALFDVLMRIWDEIEPLSDKIGLILFADIASLFLFGFPHAPSKKLVCNPRKYVIYFPGILCDQPEAEIKRVIAHEFAHFALGHTGLFLAEDRKQGEQDADDLAAKWGFPPRTQNHTKPGFTSLT